MAHPLKILKNVVAVGFGILLALLVFAPIIELTDSNSYNIQKVDPATGLPTYFPHTEVHELTGCFENDAQINNYGFHGPDVSVQKPPTVFRIVVIGGSYIEARQVQVDQMFTTLLEQKLNADPNKKYTYEVVPIGFDGNGTLLNDLYYKYYGSPLKPDLVIDLESQHELLYELDAAPLDASGHAILTVPSQPHVGVLKELLRHSKLLINLYNRLLLFESAAEDFLQRPLFFVRASSAASPDAAEAEAARWKIKNPLVDAMASLVRADGAKLFFATFTARDQPSGTEEEQVSHFSQLATKDGFAYDDLVPYIHTKEDDTGVSATFSCDDHFSPAGHQYVAEELYEYLTARSILLEK